MLTDRQMQRQIRDALNFIAECENPPLAIDVARHLDLDERMGDALCKELDLCGYVYRERNHPDEPWRITLKGKLSRWVLNKLVG